MRPRYHSLQEIQQLIHSGQLSCSELVDYYLSRIKAMKQLNAYIEVFEDEAKAKAKSLDNKFRSNANEVGRLFGMVVSLKDVLCYKGHKVSASSKILQGFTSLYSATAVERLLNEDAIIIGRVNCDQFGMGSSNENSFYGPVKNAANPGYVPGGSSGGCAVSVQADTCLASIGTDTGGSVRQPAAFCGLVGVKPTYGRISRHGLLAYASSFDQIGTLTHNIEDAALLLEVMAGKDDFDSTASQEPVGQYSNALQLDRKMRIAYLDSAVHHRQLDKDIQDQTLQLISRLRAYGHDVQKNRVSRPCPDLQA